ncbi:arginase [bacterium]|nr:arginase [bacterium]
MKSLLQKSGLTKMTKRICFISTPTSLGGNVNGSDLGPFQILDLNLFRGLQKDHKFIEIDSRNDLKKDRNNSLKDVCLRLKSETFKNTLLGYFPFVLGGDHSISSGSLSAVASAYSFENKESPGLIWFDAHADLNTHLTSPSGNLHGMPLAALIGEKVKHLSDVVGSSLFDPKKVVILGLRDVDPGETALLDKENITYFSAEEIKKQGLAEIAKKVSLITGDDYCLSFDIDSIDPLFAPGVGTPVDRGFDPKEAIDLLDQILTKGNLLSLDFVEYNPLHDKGGKTKECVEKLLDFLISKIG